MPFTTEILIFCFGENLLQSLMEKNVKFVLNDVKDTAFFGFKRRNIRASILVPLASQSNVAQGEVKRRYAALRVTLLCAASGTRIDALMSRLFEPKKAVAFTSFSTNFTFFFP